ncbi:ATP-dependent Clp protease ATP-binding subunit [Pseudomonas savastanoi pv. glycinea]|nr:ATP-dependent Clp protease ATP-binding subunit [Pseudomonas savastanoi pv. glycinea]
MRSDSCCLLYQVFTLQQLQRREPGSARHRMCRIGIAVGEFDGVFRRWLIHEGLIDLAAGDHCAHGDRAIGDLLGDTHQVRRDTETVRTKHRACTAEAGNDFVEYQQDIVLITNLAQTLEIALRWNDHAGRARHGFDDYRRDVRRIVQLDQLEHLVGQRNTARFGHPLRIGVAGQQRVRQMVDILTRRRQNNPILTGEAGVGKTAVVEGLALRIVQGDVPSVLKGVAIHTLDLGLLQAGAGVKGEFENRLKSVIEETKRSLHPIILFIDEAHTLIGSGGQAGQNDAANLLKPALARGELRTIAATTWAEYKKYFEKDAALARRFQVVKVEEPDEDKAIHMLRGLLAKMQEHHKVTVMDEALVQAVRLSNRYITGRQLPDKAVSVLDTACARVALGQSAQPGALEDCKRHIDNLNAEITVLEQETAKGSDHARRLTALHEELKAEQETRESLEQQWKRELELVEKLGALSVPEDGAPDAEQIAAVRAELASVQGEQPLVHALVDGGTIGEVISGWTGIPLGKMLRDEIDTVQSLPALLGERVLGQDHALEEIGKRIKISRARMEDPNKPIGVFLLLGPSGVGKTETALALADTLYGGERNVITINMSEYQEAHTVSSLKGSPPGYVGYGEGGVLTEAVRRKPYSVVLLDEVEKAHPDVLELFFQVFDKGVLDDGEGREINFRNTVIILTSNTGTDRIMQWCLNTEQKPTPDDIVEGLRDELNQVFKPAFLGRLTIVPYYPVQDAILERIVGLKLERIRKRFERNHQAVLRYDEALIKAIASRCTEVDSGARNIDNILSKTLMPELAQRVLERMAQDKPIQSLTIDLGSDGDFAYTLT